MIYRKMALVLIVMAGVCSTLSAQCDKKFKLKTERVYQVKADSTEGDSIPVSAEITLSKDSIFVLMNWTNGGVTEVKGKHAETICKMNKEYTDGTIDYKTDAEMKAQGQIKNAKMLFNLVSKAGKIKVYGVPEGENDKICFVIKEKEEIK